MGEYRKKVRYIQLFVPFFTLYAYIGILIVLTLGIAYLFRKGGWIGSVTFGLVGFALGIFLLDIVTGLFKAKIKKLYIEFQSILSGYMCVSDNMLTALKETSNHVQDPLQTILKTNMYLYEKGQVTEKEMYHRIRADVNDDEFSKLFFILETSDTYGGNINDTLDEIRGYATEIYKVEQQISATAKVGVFVTFFMIAMNLLLFNRSLNEPDTLKMLTSTVLGGSFMVLNLVCIVLSLLIARWMMK